jgi:hypothetical protein
MVAMEFFPPLERLTPVVGYVTLMDSVGATVVFVMVNGASL